MATTEDLRGGDTAHNAEVVRRLLAGEPGAVRDAVLLNAGAALAVYAGEQGGLEDRLAAGLARATEALDSGAAAATLERSGWLRPPARRRRRCGGTRCARSRAPPCARA